MTSFAQEIEQQRAELSAQMHQSLLVLEKIIDYRNMHLAGAEALRPDGMISWTEYAEIMQGYELALAQLESELECEDEDEEEDWK